MDRLDSLLLISSIWHVFLHQVLLELRSRLAVIAPIVNVKNEFPRTNCLDKAFELSIVGVRTVGHLVVKRHIAVVLVVPPGQDDEHGRLLLVACVDTKKSLNNNRFGGLLVVFEFSDVFDVDDGVGLVLIGSKQFWRQVEQLDLFHPIVVHNNLCVEVVC